MSSTSQLTMVILNYIGIFGLLISGLLSIFLTYKRKKLLFLFLSFLFTGVLNFVYYSGVLFFVVGLVMMFFFLLLYLFVFQLEVFRGQESAGIKVNLKVSNKDKALDITTALLFCAGFAYFIYIYTSDFLRIAKTAGDSAEILIASWSDIGGQLFAEYGLILIIVAVSLFLSFLWFVAIGGKKK